MQSQNEDFAVLLFAFVLGQLLIYKKENESNGFILFVVYYAVSIYKSSRFTATRK